MSSRVIRKLRGEDDIAANVSNGADNGSGSNSDSAAISSTLHTGTKPKKLGNRFDLVISY